MSKSQFKAVFGSDCCPFMVIESAIHNTKEMAILDAVRQAVVSVIPPSSHREWLLSILSEIVVEEHGVVHANRFIFDK